MHIHDLVAQANETSTSK